MSQPDVLVVDDDAEIRESIADLLRDEGYGTAVAAHGREALEQLRGGVPADLIVLDLMMPVMDGPTFRARQRGEPDIAGIPVVVISAFQDVEDKAQRLGATAALRKPISFRDLIETVRRLCAPPFATA